MVQPTTHLGQVVQPIASRLQTYTACYYTKQHEIKSSTRENNTIKRRSKHQIYEAAARVTQHTVLHKTSFFISTSIYSKIMIKKYSIVQLFIIIIKQYALSITVCSTLLYDWQPFVYTSITTNTSHALHYHLTTAMASRGDRNLSAPL